MTKIGFSTLLLLSAPLALLPPGTHAAAPAAPQEVITGRSYLEISGTAITDLTGSTKFPNSPDATVYLPYFEWNATGDINTPPPTAVADNYGVQIVGYFYPPVSGDYVFWLSSDDNGNLYLSTDGTPANKKLIAQETGYSGLRSWESVGSGTVESKNSQTFAGTEWPTKDPASGGAKITLEKGRAYYIEAISKEGSGDDNLAVAVAAPDGSIDPTLPIPGQYLSTFDKTSGPLSVTTQPANQTAREGESATFGVVVDGTPPYQYQWQKNGANLVDATNSTYTLARAPRADNNAKFRVVITSPAGSVNSSEATLTVTPDTTPPTVVLASTSLGKSVKVEFSEWVDPASATNKANYSIPNITITDATISEDNKTVTLAITGSLPANFELTLGGIQDFGGNPIPANTKVPGYTTGLEPSMISYWPLDKIEGTKTPDIISGYDLLLENMAPENLVAGKFGKCFQFDNARKALLKRVHGTNDALPIYKYPAFTVSIWVNGPVQTDHRVFCESSSKNNQPMFSIGTHNTGSDGTLDTFIRNNSGTTSNDHHHHEGVPFDDAWHHIVYIQNSNSTPRAVIYIDGVKDNVNPEPVWPLSVDTTALGAIQRAASAAWFTGMIDDVAVWSRALDPDEVDFLYTKGTPTPPPKVLPLAISQFQADLNTVAKGDSVTLHWDVNKDVTSIVIEPELGDVTAKTQLGVGSAEVTPSTTTTYRITIKRGNDTLSSDLQVPVIDGVAAGWVLLDNFDRYAPGGLPKPWGVSGAGVTVVDVNGNHLLSVAGGGDTLAGLVLNKLTLKEGDERTLFARFYLPEAVAAAGLAQYMGLSDKGIRFFSDSQGDLGPDVTFQNPDGTLQIGTWNGYGSGVELASFSLQPATAYNLWIDVRNDPIAEGDLFSVHIAKEGDAARTTLFSEYRSDRNPNDTGILGPTTPDLDVLTVAGNNTTSRVYFDDFYMSKSGYLSTVPRSFGFTTPVGGGGNTEAPSFKAARLESGSFKVDLATQSGVTYLLESATSLPAASWQTAQTISGTGQVITIPLSPAGAAQFFRIRVP